MTLGNPEVARYSAWRDMRPRGTHFLLNSSLETARPWVRLQQLELCSSKCLLLIWHSQLLGQQGHHSRQRAVPMCKKLWRVGNKCKKCCLTSQNCRGSRVQHKVWLDKRTLSSLSRAEPDLWAALCTEPPVRRCLGKHIQQQRL